MDKGLIAINELKEKIKEVQKSENQNSSKKTDMIKAYKMLMQDISVLEEKSINLSEKKKKNLEAPQKRKKEKKKLIPTIIEVYLLTTFVAFVIVLMGSAGTVPIIKCILSSLLLSGLVCGIAIPVEFKNINKKYPIFDSANIENEILLNNKNLKTLYTKKNELDGKLVKLQEESEELNKVITDLQKEIDSIVSIRTKIIEEYCSNNPELDKKLDAEYDKSKVKEKVK